MTRPTPYVIGLLLGVLALAAPTLGETFSPSTEGISKSGLTLQRRAAQARVQPRNSANWIRVDSVTLASQLDAVLAKTASEDSSLPSVVALIDAPLFGIHWRSGVDGPRAGPASGDPALRPFRIASVTKLMVAATILKLVENGHLDMLAPIGTLIPPRTFATLARGGYDPSVITVAQLLSHTSGLYDHAQSDTYLPSIVKDPTHRWTPDEQITYAIDHGSRRGDPGKAFSYSDTGYVILGQIIERATGKPLPVAVRETVNLDALPNTWWETLEAAPALSPPRARQYFRDVDWTDFDPSFDLYGGGGLVSTVDDLAGFARAIFNGSLLAPRTLATGLVTPSAATPMAGTTHGYLGFSARFGKRWCLGHKGFWGTALVYCPDLDLAAVVTLNQPVGRSPAELQEVVDALAGEVENAIQIAERRAQRSTIPLEAEPKEERP